MKLHLKRFVLFCLAVLIIPHQTFADSQTTTFDTGIEGWRYYITDSAPSEFGPLTHNAGSGSVFRTTPAGGNDWSVASPDDFGGDWTQWSGGTLTFDMKVEGTGLQRYQIPLIFDFPGPENDPDQIGTFVGTDIVLGPKGQWNTYKVRLVDSSIDFTGENTSGTLSTNLDNIYRIFVKGNVLINSSETVSIDNVTLSTDNLLADTIKFGMVLADNRQYDGHFNAAKYSGFWGPVGQDGKGQIQQIMIAAADVNRDGDTINEMDFGPEPESGNTVILDYRGNTSGLKHGYVKGWSQQDTTAWADKSFTFRLKDSSDNTQVIDTLTINTNGFTFPAMDVPQVTITAGDDPGHPTISWNAVPGADKYLVLVLGIDCKSGDPAHNTIFYSSGKLTGLSHKIPADVDAIPGRPVAVWVQARNELAGYGQGAVPLDFDLPVNRSSFFAYYDPITALPSSDLTAGWSEKKWPDNTIGISMNAQANAIAISATATTEGDDFFDAYEKKVSGLRGTAVTFNISQIQGGIQLGLRKDVGQLHNGNVLRADLRITNDSYGNRQLNYRIRELTNDAYEEVNRKADGRLNAWWDLNSDITLSLMLIDGTVQFLANNGVNNVCGPFSYRILGPDFTPWSSKARITVNAYKESGDQDASVTAVAKDVKLIMNYHLPEEKEPEKCLPGDYNGDGKLGIDDAMKILQVNSGGGNT